MLATHDPETLLDQASANRAASRQVGFERLRIARDWALANIPDPAQLARAPICAHQVGASELLVLQHVEAELAAEPGITPLAGLRLMADAIDLHRRLPSTWGAASDFVLEAWVARKIADKTRVLTHDQARWVDAQIAGVLATLPTGRLLKLVDARVVEADQVGADQRAALKASRRGVWRGRETADGSAELFVRARSVDVDRFYAMADHVAHLLREHCPDLAEESMDELRGRAAGLMANPMALLSLLIGAGEDVAPEVVAEAIRRTSPQKYRPRTTCYVHFTPSMLLGQGVARAEELGALTRQQLIDLLGHEHVTLKPVIDLNADMAADCYEVPDRISEHLHLSRSADCFPYASSTSRKQDKDHTVPYQWCGPPDQTRTSNLGHLVRRHHRVKTFGGWRVWQDHEGRFTWISPHGRIYLTDAHGTHRVEVHPGQASFEVMLAGDYTLAG